MKIKRIALTIASTLLMCGVLSGCSEENNTSTDENAPDFVVSMSSLGYDDIPNYKGLTDLFNEHKEVPTTLSFKGSQETRTQVTEQAYDDKTIVEPGSYNPITKKFSFGEKVKSFLYDTINTHLLNFQPTEGMYYQFGYTNHSSTKQRPYCIVEYNKTNMTIYGFEHTGHISYLKYSPTKETVKVFEISKADEYEITKGATECVIKKYIGYSNDTLLMPVRYLTLPVTTIKKDVFKEKEITKIFYLGTPTQFADLNIEEGNDCLATATKYFYSENTPTESGNYFHFVDGEIEIYNS